MSDLVFYNTRTRKKEPFRSIREGEAGMYTCGPTVYGPQHIGNVRSQLFADLLKRTLIAAGYRVTHVINITDVGHLTDDGDAGDDKMELAAQRAGRSATDIAEMYTEMWRVDRANVNCLEPEVLCKATDHIAEQIALGKVLEEKGFTYRIDDGIYFDTGKFSAYADFARLDLEGQAEGGRIAEVAGKRNPSDFAIWKFAEEGVKRLQEWDSPWGRGFPGWHLECSAMSSKYLGDHFDIHTGGIDLVTVHHTNEIAQSECASGQHPWVNFWMHNEFIDFGGEKMSKSKGNVHVLDDLVERGLEPLAYRYFFLQTHYRQQQNFSEEAIEGAAVGYRRLLKAAIEVRGETAEGSPEVQASYRERFRRAMFDDLNAPKAMAVVWDVARNAELFAADRRDLLLEFDEILGLDLARAELAEGAQESDPRIDALVVQRTEARANKDWAEADRIRDELAADGIVVTDTPDGATWRRE